MATKGILAWDGGVLLYLILSASLFATEPGDCMSANAEAQQEGEWTIFGLTLAVVIVSFIIVGIEFFGHQASIRRNAIVLRCIIPDAICFDSNVSNTNRVRH